jgi:uncharacterized paraquat-inducible protein A
MKRIRAAAVISVLLAHSAIAGAQDYNYYHPSVQQHTYQMMERQALQQQMQQQIQQQQMQQSLQPPTQQQTIDQIMIDQQQHDMQNKLNSYR